MTIELFPGDTSPAALLAKLQESAGDRAAVLVVAIANDDDGGIYVSWCAPDLADLALMAVAAQSHVARMIEGET